MSTVGAGTEPAATPPSRAVRVGLLLFAVGLGFIVAAVIPFFDGDSNRSLWVNLCCLLAPLGFVIALWAGLRRGRREQRAALREIADDRRPGAVDPSRSG